MASEELHWLVKFLNLDLGGKARTILSDWMGKREGITAATEKFLKDSKLAPGSDAAQLQSMLRHDLAAIIAPETLCPSCQYPDRAAEELAWFKENVVKKYLAKPDRWLGELVARINKVQVPVNWRIRPATQGKENLHVRGTKWFLEKREFKEEAWFVIPRVLSRVLEQDEIDDLGRCPVCRNFFVRSRPWQNYCGPDCKDVHDKSTWAERKKRQRAKQANQKKAKMKTEKAKAKADKRVELRNLLASGKFNRILKGGPSERQRLQTEYLSQLQTAKSVKDFLAKCPPEVRKIIEQEID